MNSRKRRGIEPLLRRRIVLAGLLLCAASIGGVVAKLRQTYPKIAPLPESRVLYTGRLDSATYKLIDDGRVYRVDAPGKRWVYVDTIFDPKTIRETYVTEGKTVYRVDRDSGKRYQTLQTFQEGFEDLPTGAAGLRSLIGEARKWTEVTLQSPRAPSVPEYVALAHRILESKGDYLDARVEPSTEQAHGGSRSLKSVCPPKSGAMVCAKASLSTGLIYYVKGQDVWYRAWYRIDSKTPPLTLVDLEDSLVKESPGIRVMLFEGDELGVELKAVEKPTYRQSATRRTHFPIGRWVEVTWHIRLDDGPTGRVQLWQDGVLVVDAAGQTLPFRTAIYNSLEIGISAHSNTEQPATLFVDDLLVTTKPLR